MVSSEIFNLLPGIIRQSSRTIHDETNSRGLPMHITPPVKRASAHFMEKRDMRRASRSTRHVLLAGIRWTDCLSMNLGNVGQNGL